MMSFTRAAALNKSTLGELDDLNMSNDERKGVLTELRIRDESVLTSVS